MDFFWIDHGFFLDPTWKYSGSIMDFFRSTMNLCLERPGIFSGLTVETFWIDYGFFCRSTMNVYLDRLRIFFSINNRFFQDQL